MVKFDILKKLENKETSADELVEHVKGDLDLLPVVYEGVSSTIAHVRYPCAKVLMLLSEKNPELLYPNMDFFIEMLESDKRILKWNALNIIANLTRVDVKNRFDGVFDKYFSHLEDDYLVTVANIISGAGRIAIAKPHLAGEITDKLLKVENLSLKPHLTQECKNILFGHAISAFEMYFDQIEGKDEVISFAKRQLENTRNSTRKKAEKFLKKFE